MKNLLWVLAAATLLILGGCAKPTEYNPNGEEPDGLADLLFGTDSTLEVVTWNLKEFPIDGDSTVKWAADLIYHFDADLVALQEIGNDQSFEQVISLLNAYDDDNTWDGYRSDEASYSIDLAVIYKTDVLAVSSIYEIHTSNWYAFPRPPLIIDFSFEGSRFLVVNNHLKASSGIENEERRRAASILLEEFFEASFSSNVIILGDLNDEITDDENINVFWNFISQPDSFKFVDMDIAQGISSQWSYPSYPSHIDHILINSPLFDEFDDPSSEVKTIRIHDFLDGSWNQYKSTVSDHLPVAWKFKP